MLSDLSDYCAVTDVCTAPRSAVMQLQEREEEARTSVTSAAAADLSYPGWDTADYSPQQEKVTTFT